MGAEGGGGATRGSPPAPKRGRGTEVCKEHASRREGAMLCLCKITPYPHRCPVPGRGAWSGGARGSVVFVWLLPARHPVFLAPGAGGRVALLLSDPHRVVFGHHPVITSPLEEVTLRSGMGGGGKKNKYKSNGGACVCGGDGAAERGSGVVNSRAGGGERESRAGTTPTSFPLPPVPSGQGVERLKKKKRKKRKRPSGATRAGAGHYRAGGAGAGGCSGAAFPPPTPVSSRPSAARFPTAGCASPPSAPWPRTLHACWPVGRNRTAGGWGGWGRGSGHLGDPAPFEDPQPHPCPRRCHTGLMTLGGCWRCCHRSPAPSIPWGGCQLCTPSFCRKGRG